MISFIFPEELPIDTQETDHDQIVDNVGDIENAEIRGRKRPKDESQWKRYKKKFAKNRGQGYTDYKGAVVHSRVPQFVRCKCHYKCSDKISQDMRIKIFQSYWSSGDYIRQRDYIARNVTAVEKKCARVNGESRRAITYQYHLTKENGSVRVCKSFFLKTLDVGQRTVYYALNAKFRPGNSTTGEGFISPDRRGKASPKNKTSPEDRQFVKAHIDSFPAVESHYCRKRTSRKYLDSDLNVSKMYLLYINLCEQVNRHPVKIHVYRTIFNTNYNYSFHKPKKDMCSLCDSFKKASDTDQDKLRVEFDAHQVRKTQARDHKARDKERELPKARYLSALSISTFRRCCQPHN